MSYILDALKKADAERERGVVPGIHSHPAPLVMAPETGPRALGPVAWVLAGLGGVLVVLLGWRVLSPGAESAEPRSGTAEGQQVSQLPPGGQASPSPPPLQRQPAQPAAPIEGRAEWPATQVQTPPQPTRQAAPPEPETRPRAAPVPDQRQAQARTPPPVAQAVTTPQPTAGPSASTPTPDGAADHHVYALSELPEPLRRELPTMLVSGAVYAEKRSARMLFVNGQVFHEGDQAAPELVLDEIRPKSAVFKYKGYRYAVGY
jgi:general secretion pathway protein B